MGRLVVKKLNVPLAEIRRSGGQIVLLLLLFLLLIWKMKSMQLFCVVVAANYESGKIYLFHFLLPLLFFADSLPSSTNTVALLSVKEILFAARYEISFGLKWRKSKTGKIEMCKSSLMQH